MAVFNGGPGDDVFNGGGENDTINGNGGTDFLAGGDGADTIDGGEGNDSLWSAVRLSAGSIPFFPNYSAVTDTGSAVDSLSGGIGDDFLSVGYGDSADGGTHLANGDALVISFMGASSGVVADFGPASVVIGGGTIANIERFLWIQGSAFDDDITGRMGATAYPHGYTIEGMGGNDKLTAGYYTQILDGGEGNDILDGRNSQILEHVYGGAGNDTIYTNPNRFYAIAEGGAGDDTIYSNYETRGGSGNDTIILSPYPDFADDQGSPFNYVGAYGEEGNDDITASSTGNPISGGAGADILRGGAASDMLASAGMSRLVPTADGSPLIPDWDMGLEHDVLTGGGGDDVLAIGYGDDADGGAGTDSLRLSLGGLAAGTTFNTSVILTGQPLNLGGGTIQNIETLTHLRGTNFADILILATQSAMLTVEAGDGNDEIRSGGSSTTIYGGNGDDFLISGSGADYFDGGAGNDTADYRNATAMVIASIAPPDQPGYGANGDELRNIENLHGSAFGDVLYGNLLANRLDGGGGNDTLIGFGGDDQLYGGAGADRTEGGLGNDFYTVDNAGDVVVENANEGADTVATSISYTLGANVENLQAANIGGTDPLSLTGNALNNFIWGTQGNNVIDGAGGADFMIGYAGNDFYHVDNTGDIAYELDGGGSDTVATTISYTLAAHVENLQAVNIGGTDPLALTGNALNNYIWATQGNNVIDGGAGADVMIGYGGNDFYFVDNAADVTVENAGGGEDTVAATSDYALGANMENLQAANIGGTAALSLTGNEQNNFIWGTQGNNVLSGRGGNDRIFGYAGADQFLFNTAPGAANADWLDDFQAGTDKILLDNAVFTALSDGALPASAFVTGTAAADADDRIIFNAADGSVYYDADGNGAGAALLIAYVPVGQPLTAADFLVV
ncbi:MAG TPA: calcium-binding protein [Allosphingosinicella sp.]|jgi:Ca2+-binding RTX toxin-like protein